MKLATKARLCNFVKSELISVDNANLQPMCEASSLVQTLSLAKSKQHVFGNSVLLKIGL